jgi:hypothetical protein
MFGIAVLLPAILVSAQSNATGKDSFSTSSPAAESSSRSVPVVGNGGDGEMAALPAAPGASASGGGQNGGDEPHGIASHLKFAAGGGFNGPSGASSSQITWGGNFTLGTGYRFNSRLGLMAEYQFIDDKLPGAVIAETGANGGYAHIWSLTLAPVFDLFPKSKNDVYLTGGGGFYRKVTSFTDPQQTEYCDYYYCEPGIVNQVVGHFSSNQGGWNFGGGFQHRIGGMYGDSRMKLFAEIRFLDVMTPAVQTSPNGLGTTTVGAGTKLIPVTLGVRW